MGKCGKLPVPEPPELRGHRSSLPGLPLTEIVQGERFERGIFGKGKITKSPEVKFVTELSRSKKSDVFFRSRVVKLVSCSNRETHRRFLVFRSPRWKYLFF